MVVLNEPVIQSNLINLRVIKFCDEIIWMGVCLVVALNNYGRSQIDYVLIVLAFVLSGFHLSIAAIRVRNGDLQYRRFMRWQSIDKGAVRSFGPFPLGYLRLGRFVPPWGRIWFVL